jgi:imidazolonepropionase
MSDCRIITDAGIAIHDGKNIEIDPFEIEANTNVKEVDASGKVLLPGFVDPHTHPVFVHTREDEFAMRLAGASYVDIAKAGGGILSTLRSTRTADSDLLFSLAAKRIRKMISLGLRLWKPKADMVWIRIAN